MSYIEWVLARCAALAEEMEEAVKKRLTTGKRYEEEAEKRAEETRAEKTGEETDAAAAETLRVNGTRRDEETSERAAENGGYFGSVTAATPVGMTARAARDAEEESGAAWMQRTLKRDGTAAAGVAAARERQERSDGWRGAHAGEDAATALALEESLERDARRYDSGFLYY